MKTCKTCNIEKDYSFFHKQKAGDGFTPECKDCKVRKYRESNPCRNKTTYVYVITHPKFDGWCKIGRASDPLKRLKGYNVGCPYRIYEIKYSLEVLDPYPYERYFNDNIKSNGFEWFNIKESEAIEIMNKIYNNEINVF